MNSALADERVPLLHTHTREWKYFPQLDFWPAERITELPKSRNGAPPYQPASHRDSGNGLRDGDSLSRARAKPSARTDRRTIRGDGAESGQLLLVANVEAFT